MSLRNASPKPILVNLGCGARYHSAWTNIDIAPHGRGVIKHNLSRNIPLESCSCDVVYHSAVLEHIRVSDTKAFLVECKRVLKPGGILRIGVPDLEKMCGKYLSILQSAINGSQNAAYDYDWIILELCDQLVREQSGGEMLAYLRQNPIPNEQFIIERIGEEGRNLINSLRCPVDGRTISEISPEESSSVWRSMSELLRQGVASIRMILLKHLLGAEGMKALEIGRFRLSGEVHQWMYDRYSLARLLVAVGFSDPVHQTASSSRILNWNSYNLEALPDGRIIKPDLFYMEAIKR